MIIISIGGFRLSCYLSEGGWAPNRKAISDASGWQQRQRPTTVGLMNEAVGRLDVCLSEPPRLESDTCISVERPFLHVCRRYLKSAGCHGTPQNRDTKNQVGRTFLWAVVSGQADGGWEVPDPDHVPFLLATNCVTRLGLVFVYCLFLTFRFAARDLDQNADDYHFQSVSVYKLRRSTGKISWEFSVDMFNVAAVVIVHMQYIRCTPITSVSGLIRWLAQAPGFSSVISQRLVGARAPGVYQSCQSAKVRWPCIGIPESVFFFVIPPGSGTSWHREIPGNREDRGGFFKGNAVKEYNRGLLKRPVNLNCDRRGGENNINSTDTYLYKQWRNLLTWESLS